MEGEQGVRAPESRSRELLGVGSVSEGLYSKLLINSKHDNKSSAAPTIVRMPRSGLLDRIQNFLPQMAQANESLSKQMETLPAEAFDIENIDDEGKIIEMNVAVVELSDDDSSEAESSSDGSSDSDLGEVTEDNIKLRKATKKGKIEVIEQ